MLGLVRTVSAMIQGSRRPRDISKDEQLKADLPLMRRQQVEMLLSYLSARQRPRA